MKLDNYILTVLRAISPENDCEIEFDLCLDSVGRVVEHSATHVKFTLNVKTKPEETS